MPRRTVVVRFYRREGRLTPPRASGLRARSVALGPGEAVAWHSTGVREELLVALVGRLRLEWHVRVRGTRKRSLSAGQCAFLQARVEHRVVNPSKRRAHYVYVTGSAR